MGEGDGVGSCSVAELRLKVREARSETPTIRSVRLALEGETFSFKPGQFCLVALDTEEGADDRALSIANSPTRPESLLFASRRSDSAYKKAFFALKPGDAVTVSGPLGKFVYDEDAPHTVLLSGGIGITPLKSMVEYACDRALERRITLLYANRSPGEIAFRAELEALSRANPRFTLVQTVSYPEEGWRGRTGRIDEDLIRRSVPEPDAARYYLCGPPGMVSALRDTLKGMGLSGGQVRAEKFTGYE